VDEVCDYIEDETANTEDDELCMEDVGEDVYESCGEPFYFHTYGIKGDLLKVGESIQHLECDAGHRRRCFLTIALHPNDDWDHMLDSEDEEMDIFEDTWCCEMQISASYSFY
jgi:hypothetical protein